MWQDQFGTTGQNGPLLTGHYDPNNSYTRDELGQPTVQRTVYDPLLRLAVPLSGHAPPLLLLQPPNYSYGPEGCMGMPSTMRENGGICDEFIVPGTPAQRHRRPGDRAQEGLPRLCPRRGYEREEFDKIWFKGQNATWGHNFGRMVGFRQIYHNHTIDEESRAAEETFRLGEAFPSTWAATPAPSAPAASTPCPSCALRWPTTASPAAAGPSPLSVMMSALGNPPRPKPGEGPGPGGPGGPKPAPKAEDYRHFGAASWEYYGADFIYHEGAVEVHPRACGPCLRPAL